MNARIAPVLVAILSAAPVVAQGQYAFDEREPETLLEKLTLEKLSSLVKVHGASGLATIKAYATGVVVSDEGHVLTLDLIMIQKDRTRIVLPDGSVHQAKLLAADPKLGVRLLKIDPAEIEIELPPLAPSTKSPNNGTFVLSIGNCFRLAEFSEKMSATFGVITATTMTGLRYRLHDVDYEGKLIITDAPNNPGHYGGALFTLEGEWIGLNTRVVESTETNTQISAAIPTSDLIAFLDRHVHGKIPAGDAEEAAAARPVATGIVLFDHGGRRSPPAYIERVQRGSPAAKIGLRPDDLIVRIDDYTIRSCKEFRNVLEKFAPGQKIDVTFKRGTAVRKATMELEAAR